MHGVVYGMETQGIVRITPAGIVSLRNFGRERAGGVSGFLPGGIAVSPQGRIYTDTAYGNGWSDGSAIISIAPGGALTALWSKR